MRQHYCSLREGGGHLSTYEPMWWEGRTMNFHNGICTGLIKQAYSSNPSFKSFVILGLTVFDFLFELIIKMSFKMVAKGNFIKDRGSVMEAVEA